MPNTPSRDVAFKPRDIETLVKRAFHEIETWNVIFSDTAALLMEHGVDVEELEEQLRGP